MIYCPLIFQNSCPPLEDKKVLIFVEKLKKMQPLKMTFRVNQSPQSRVMIVLCSKFQIWKSHRIDGFLKYLNRFFFQKPRKSKNALYYQKYLRFLCEIDQKVPIFVENSKKMQPPKTTFRSQLEPSIKSYECFMFLLNFRLEITLD